MQNFLMGFLGLLFVGSIDASAARLNPGMATQSFAADLSTFTYWVRIPSTTQTCEQEAMDLGKRFAQGTELEVVSSVCRGTVSATFGAERDTLYSILVTYRAEYAVNPYTASIEPGVLAPQGMSPAYATYMDCRADLEAQQAAFTANTKLVAVSAACDVARSALEGFTMRIDGFGQPAMRLNAFMLSFYGELADDVIPTGRDFLIASGAQIVRSVEKTFYFYSTSMLSLRQQNFGFFKSLDECNMELGSAREILRNAGSTRMFVSCSKHLGGGSLDILADGYGYLNKSYANLPKYFSMEECTGDRLRVLGDARRGGRDAYVFGGICHDSLMESGRYEMDIYTKGY